MKWVPWWISNRNARAVVIETVLWLALALGAISWTGYALWERFG